MAKTKPVLPIDPLTETYSRFEIEELPQPVDLTYMFEDEEEDE